MIPKIKDHIRSKISPTERRAAIVLLFFVLCVIVAGKLKEYAYHYRYKPDEELLTKWKQAADSLLSATPVSTYRKFDPNTDSYDTLIAKGLSGSLSRSMINYREKVGPFDSKDELARLYLMDQDLFKEIEAYIEIQTTNADHQAKVQKVYVEHFELFINSAEDKDWKKIRGIGEVLSKRIVAYKELLGGFVSVDQLSEVYGISDSLYISMKHYLVVDSVEIQRINVALASFRDLIRHPYLNKEQVIEILNRRKASLPLCSMNDLWGMETFEKEKDKRLIPYLWFPCDP